MISVTNITDGDRDSSFLTVNEYLKVECERLEEAIKTITEERIKNNLPIKFTKAEILARLS